MTKTTKNIEPIIFLADSLKISGPRVDGSYQVVFTTGEYERQHVADLLTLPVETTFRVIVEAEE